MTSLQEDICNRYLNNQGIGLSNLLKNISEICIEKGKECEKQNHYHTCAWKKNGEKIYKTMLGLID